MVIMPNKSQIGKPKRSKKAIIKSFVRKKVKPVKKKVKKKAIKRLPIVKRLPEFKKTKKYNKEVYKIDKVKKTKQGAITRQKNVKERKYRSRKARIVTSKTTKAHPDFNKRPLVIKGKYAVYTRKKEI